METAIAEVQDHVFFSSNDARDNFKRVGIKNTSFVPLGFDEDFKQTGKDYLADTVHFGLMGKFENRKHTQKIIKTWLKKYGNNNKYLLTCCVNNPFFKPEQLQGLIQETLEGKHYNNINFLPILAKNSEVNEFLNSIDIDLTGLSGGEGWNLPAFNSTESFSKKGNRLIKGLFILGLKRRPLGQWKKLKKKRDKLTQRVSKWETK